MVADAMTSKLKSVTYVHANERCRFTPPKQVSYRPQLDSSIDCIVCRNDVQLVEHNVVVHMVTVRLCYQSEAVECV